MRTNAAESLGFFQSESKRSVPPLLELLSDGNTEVRRATIISLGRIGKRADKVGDALKKFTDDPDPLVKLNSVVALAGFGRTDDSTIPVLLSALGNKDEATAKAAGRVLSAVAVDKPDKVGNKDEATAKAAGRMPGGVATEKSDKVLLGLEELLDRKEQPSLVNALKVLRSMKTHAAPALPKIAALYDKAQPVDRVEIIDALVAIDAQGDHALPVLIKALKEPDPQDRKEALMSLLRYRSQSDEFVGPLADSLSDTDTENRRLAIGIIKGLGEKGTKAVPKLIALIDDPDISVRSTAINAISSFPPDQAVFEALEKAIKNSDPQTRMAAIGALRRTGPADPQKASEILQRALTSESNEPVKRSISSALDSLKKPQPQASDTTK